MENNMETTGILGVILGLYRVVLGLYRGCIGILGVILGLYWFMLQGLGLRVRFGSFQGGAHVIERVYRGNYVQWGDL